MYRVLFADDEILERDTRIETIDWETLEFHFPKVCKTGAEAIEFIKENQVDLLITDICTPYMDGMELCHYMHENYPKTLLIVLSKSGEFEYVKKAMRYNVCDYLLKPVNVQEFTQVLTNMREKLDHLKIDQERIQNLSETSMAYKKNELWIRSQALSSLVTCSKGVQECLTELKNMGVCLKKAEYRVAILSLDIYSELYTPNVKQRQESALMGFVLCNIAEEIVNQYNAGVVYMENNNRVAVLFQLNGLKESCKTIQRIAEKIREKLLELMNLDVSISVGSYVKDWNDLHISYEKAESGLKYRYLLGGGLYLDMEKEGVSEQSLVLDEALTALADAIRKDQQNKIEQILENIRLDIMKCRVDRSKACIYLHEVIRLVSELAEKVHTNPGAVQKHKTIVLNEIVEQKTFSDAMEKVKTYVYSVREYLNLQNSSSVKRQALQAAEYIEENYGNSNLNLNSICSYLGISTSYFSTIFKEETGETFMEFLIRTRMEHAKDLLETTTLKNYEIADRVGFSDPHYFGISFKKMTGMTPTEYAKVKRG